MTSFYDLHVHMGRRGYAGRIAGFTHAVQVVAFALLATGLLMHPYSCHF